MLLAGTAGPAAAFTVESPAVLYKDALNGAQIVLSTATVNDHFPSSIASTTISFYTLQSVPSGVTLLISSITRASDQQSVTLTLNYTGNFTSDWSLSILADVSVFSETSNNQTFGPIPVRVAPLVVGAVSGQATEGGGTATFPVTLATQPSAAVTVAPGTLTYGTTDWNTAQTVTARGDRRGPDRGDGDARGERDDGYDLVPDDAGGRDGAGAGQRRTDVDEHCADFRRAHDGPLLDGDGADRSRAAPGAQSWSARQIVACAWTAV